MSMNILNDISKVYLEQVALDEAVPGRGGGSMVGKPGGPPPRTQGPQNPEDSVYSDKYREKQKNRNRSRFGPPVEEALQTPKRWWDDDGDGVGYEKGEVSDKFKKKKKKKTRVKKESFSDWRYDLSELVEVINSKKIKEKKKVGGKIEEEEVDNKELIKINPKLGGSLGEAIEELGGTLLEMVEIEDVDCIFDDLSESEVFLLSDNLIEEVVEEFFFECIQEGYGVEEIENVLVESIEISSALLTEADDIKSNRLEKVKSAVKKVGKGLARGAGYVAGAAVRGVRAVGREFSKGYDRGRGGSSGGDSSQASSPQASSPQTSSPQASSPKASSPKASSPQSDTKETGSKRPGLLGRIGSALKSGLKRAVGAGARAVSKGARNVARTLDKASDVPDGGISSADLINARAVSRGARNIARRMGNGGNGDDKPTTTQRKPSTYRGAGAGTKERVSSGSYTPPTQKKTKPAQPVSDPWQGSATAPKPAAPEPAAKGKSARSPSGSPTSGTSGTAPKPQESSVFKKPVRYITSPYGTIGSQSRKIKSAKDAPSYTGQNKRNIFTKVGRNNYYPLTRLSGSIVKSNEEYFNWRSAKLTAERGVDESKSKFVDEDLQPETPQQIAAQNAVLMAQRRLASANQSTLKKKKPTHPLETPEPTG